MFDWLDLASKEKGEDNNNPTRTQKFGRFGKTRNVNPNEANVLLNVLAKHLEHYKADPQAADEYLTVGRRAVAENIDKIELAAWTSVARIILNLHETITRN